MDIERVASCLLRLTNSSSCGKSYYLLLCHWREKSDRQWAVIVTTENTTRLVVTGLNFQSPSASLLVTQPSVCASSVGRITLTWPQVTDVTLARAWRHFPSLVANEAYEESKQVSILINLFVGTVGCFEDKCCSWSEIYSNSNPNLLLSLLPPPFRLKPGVSCTWWSNQQRCKRLSPSLKCLFWFILFAPLNGTFSFYLGKCLYFLFLLLSFDSI